MDNSKIIPLSVPSHIEKAAADVARVLESGWVSSVGPHVREFESALEKYLDVPFVSATNSGTAALHLALLAAGVSQGDAVLVPGLSFIASVNPVRYAGAEPIFFDVDQNSWTLSADAVRNYLGTECESRQGGVFSKKSGRRIAAMIAVDIFGVAAPLLSLENISQEFSIPLIEDAAESLGSSFSGKKLGGFGNFSALSFNGNKILTTGAGGAVICHSEEKAHYITHLSTQAKKDPIAYEHDEIGFNYRMNNVSAALGLSQLEYLPEMLSLRRDVYERYKNGLSPALETEQLVLQTIPDTCSANHWLTCVLLNNSKQMNLASEVVTALRAQGILARPIWAPLFMQAPYKDAERIGGEITLDTCSRGVCLPSSATLTGEQQSFVIETLLSCIKT